MKVRRIACPDCEAKPGSHCTYPDGATRQTNHNARTKAYSRDHPAEPRVKVLSPAGVLAWFDGACWRCDTPIQRHVHQVVERKGDWIHATCAPGQEDFRC